MNKDFKTLREESFSFLKNLTGDCIRKNEESIVVKGKSSDIVCEIKEFGRLASVKFKLSGFFASGLSSEIPQELFNEVNKQAPCLCFYLDENDEVCATFTTIATNEVFMTEDLLVMAISVLESSADQFVENFKQSMMIEKV